MRLALLALVALAAALGAAADVPPPSYEPSTELLGLMKTRVVTAGGRKLTMEALIGLVEKVEKQYATWTPLDVADALRRMCSYDSEHWRRLIGAPARGREVRPGAHLSKTDVEHLWLLLRRESSSKYGLGTDPSGLVINTAHAFAAIAAAQRRNKAATFSNWNHVGVGQSVDNLYVAALSGDVGQTACENRYGGQAGYVGAGTELTDEELVGDVDGLLIALHAKALGGVTNAAKAPVSKLLRRYYVTKDVAAARYSDRWHLAAYTLDWAEIRNQAHRMTNSYKLKFSKKNLFDSLRKWCFEAMGDVALAVNRLGPLTAAELKRVIAAGHLVAAPGQRGVFKHTSLSASPALYKRAGKAWQVSFDNGRNYQSVAQQRLAYDFAGVPGHRTPSVANVRLMAYLAAHPATSLGAQ